MPRRAVAGDVHIPAIFELRGDTTVEQALRFAGGLSATASLLRASLERLSAEKNRTVVDITLQGAGLATPLQPADLLRVLPISPQLKNTVTLRGNVAETGRFSRHPGMRLKRHHPRQLIAHYPGLLGTQEPTGCTGSGVQAGICQ